MTSDELAKQLPVLETKIVYDSDIFTSNENYVAILTSLLNDSKYIYMETKYPYEDFSDYLLPTRYYNWQIRCCVELYNLADKTGFTNYAENGLSFSKLADGLSNEIMWKISSRVGVPKYTTTSTTTTTSDSESA